MPAGFTPRWQPVTVLEAGAEGRAVDTIPMEEEIFATPAIAGGTLYERTQQGLYCFRKAD